MPEKLAYRVAEAGEAIGCSRAKTYELIAEGKLPAIRIGGSLRVPVDALRECIARLLAEQQAAGAESR